MIHTIKNINKIIIISFILLGCGTEGPTLDFHSNRFLYDATDAGPDHFFDDRFRGIVEDFVADGAKYGLYLRERANEIRVMEFVEDLRRRGSGPRSRYIKLDEEKNDSLLGLCYNFEHVNKYNGKLVSRYSIIKISDNFINGTYKTDLSSHTFKAVVYHELAHCLLNADHSSKDNDLKMRHPESIKERVKKITENHYDQGYMIAMGINQNDIQRNPSLKHVYNYLYNGLYYNEQYILGVIKTASESYYLDIGSQVKIMNPYMQLKESIWELNWENLTEELFLDHGGVKINR